MIITASSLEEFDTTLRHTNDCCNIFKINTIWDDISMYYGKMLYPEIIGVESLLREIIYLFMIKKVGSKWIKEGTSEHLQQEIDKVASKNGQEELLDTDILNYADFITLTYFFFDKYPMKQTNDELFNELRTGDIKTRDEMDDLIKMYEPKSNWDRYFSTKIPIADLETKWNKLYRYRNCVAHAKRIRKPEFDDANGIVDELKSKFKKCLKHLDEVELTEKQAEAVEEVAFHTFSQPHIITTQNGFDFSTDTFKITESGIFKIGDKVSSYLTSMSRPGFTEPLLPEYSLPKIYSGILGKENDEKMGDD